MGTKYIIKKYSGCTIDEDECEEGEVHASGFACGDHGTACGIPFVDEVLKYEETKKAVTCTCCINELETREKYVKRNGKWY